jgi:hypothetical protein
VKKTVLACICALLLFAALCLPNARAFAESSGAETSGDSDCGCSETGSGAYASETSGWSSGYGSTDDETEPAQAEERLYDPQTDGGINLIGINVITLAVLGAIVVMLVKNRKAKHSGETTAQKSGGNLGDAELAALAARLYAAVRRANSAAELEAHKDSIERVYYYRLVRRFETESAEAGGARVDVESAQLERRWFETGREAAYVNISARLEDGAVETAVCKLVRAEGADEWKLSQIRTA